MPALYKDLRIFISLLKKKKLYGKDIYMSTIFSYTHNITQLTYIYIYMFLFFYIEIVCFDLRFFLECNFLYCANIMYIQYNCHFTMSYIYFFSFLK